MLSKTVVAKTNERQVCICDIEFLRYTEMGFMGIFGTIKITITICCRAENFVDAFHKNMVKSKT